MKDGIFYCDNDYNLYFLDTEYNFQKIDKTGQFVDVQSVSIEEMKQRFLLIEPKKFDDIKLYEDNDYLYLFLFNDNYNEEQYYKINKLDLSNKTELKDINSYFFSHRKTFEEIKEHNDFRILIKEMVDTEGLIVFIDGKVRKEDNTYVFVKSVIEPIEL